MQPGRRVNRLPVNSYLKMQMRTGRLTGRPDGADGLTPRHGLAVGDVDGREVAVTGRVAAPMVDQDVVPVAAVPLCHENRPTGGRRDRRAGRGRDVETLMELRRTPKGVRAPAEGRGNRAGHRPRERARASHFDAARNPR